MFDESKYYLGKLCKRGHEYEGTGKSLRRLGYKGGSRRDGRCPKCIHIQYAAYYARDAECIKDRNRAGYRKHREKRLLYHKNLRIKHPELYKEMGRKSRAKGNYLEACHHYREANRERICNYNGEYRSKHRHKVNKKDRERSERARQTLQASYVRRILHQLDGLESKDIPSELIELKRTQLKALRASRAYKKGELPCQTTKPQ